MAARGNRSLHHGETHNTINFEYFYDWLDIFTHNKVYFNSLNNNQQSTSMEETKELPIFVGGEIGKVLHQEDWKSLPSEFEKYEETSHDNEKDYF